MVTPLLLARMATRWWRQWRSYLPQLLTLLVVLLVIHSWQTRHVPDRLVPDTPVTVTRADGQAMATTLVKWREGHPDQPVALHFWAEWCPICRAEEGSITRLGKDWPVLTVAMQSGPQQAVEAVMRERGLPWYAVVDPQGALAQAYGVQVVPGFLVIDPSGRVRTPTVGYTSEIGMRLRLWWVYATM